MRLVCALLCAASFAWGVIDLDDPEVISKFGWEKIGSQGTEEGMVLHQLVDLALELSPTKYSAEAEANSYKALYDQAKSAWYPTLSFTGTAELSKTRDTVADVTEEDVRYFRPALDLSWLIYDFGAREATIRESYHAYISEKETYERAVQSVIYDVVQAYYSYMGALALLDSYLQQLEESRATYDSAKELRESGISTIADELQAKSDYAQTIVLVETTRNSVTTDQAALITAIGLPPFANVRLRPLAQPSGEELDLGGSLKPFVNFALENRRDLLALRETAEKERATLRATERSILPSFDLDVNGGRTWYSSNSVDYGSSLDNSYDYTGMVTCSFDLFTGFSNTNAIRAARFDVTEAENNVRALEETVASAVISQFSSLESAQRNLLATKIYLESAEESYELARGEYSSGTNTILDVLTAQVTLADARQQRISAETSWYTDLADFLYTVGALRPFMEGEDLEQSFIRLQEELL